MAEGILESIVSNPLIIGSLAVGTIVIYLRTADSVDEAGRGTKSLLEQLGAAIVSPFSWTAGALEDTGGWLSDTIDSAFISPSELPGWLRALRRK
jgi:hypothetical protein